MRILLDPGQAAGGGGSGTTTAPAAPAPSTTPSAPTEWRASLPEEFRSEPMLQTIPDTATLVKNYVNAQRLIGTARLPEPQPQWKPEQWNDFWNKIGRPETADKYTIPEVKIGDKPVGFDPALQEKVRSHAHSLGLTAKQFEGMMSFYGNDVIKPAAEKAASDATSARAQAEQALKSEWGDKYDANVNFAKAALEKLGDADLVKYLHESGLGNHPALIKAFSKASQMLLEDRTHIRTQDLNITDATRAAAELDQLKADPNFVKGLTDPNNPARQQMLKRWNDLHYKAYPGNVPSE